MKKKSFQIKLLYFTLGVWQHDWLWEKRMVCPYCSPAFPELHLWGCSYPRWSLLPPHRCVSFPCWQPLSSLSLWPSSRFIPFFFFCSELSRTASYCSLYGFIPWSSSVFCVVLCLYHQFLDEAPQWLWYTWNIPSWHSQHYHISLAAQIWNRSRKFQS